MVRNLKKFDFFPKESILSVSNFTFDSETRQTMLKRIREHELKTIEMKLLKNMIEVEIDQSNLGSRQRASLSISPIR